MEIVLKNGAQNAVLLCPESRSGARRAIFFCWWLNPPAYEKYLVFCSSNHAL